MDNFDFHPIPEMSSTIANNQSLFDSISTTALRNEMFGHQMSRDFSAVESVFSPARNSIGPGFFSPVRNSIGPSSPRGVSKNVFDDMLNQRLHAIRAQEAVLKQKDLNLKAKELELGHRESLLIERERSLFEKQMEFQKKQHMIAKQVIQPRLDNTYCTIEPLRSRPSSPEYMEPVESTGTHTDPELYFPALRKKKRKSLLSIFGFNKSSKEESKRRKSEVEPNFKGVVQEILVSDIADKWTPETKKAAFELLSKMNTKGDLDLSKMSVSRNKGFRRGKKGRRSCFVQGSVRLYG
ncbi:hypothetical protein ACFFRR_003866 [Megaselia abdita]